MRVFLIIFISFFFFQLSITPVYSKDYSYELLKVNEIKAKKVNMIGTLATHTTKSSSNSQPLVVVQNKDNLEVYFQSSLGNLNINVVNEYGYPVFQSSVNATAGSSYSISTKRWSKGHYTISISNSQGRMKGEFLIE